AIAEQPQVGHERDAAQARADDRHGGRLRRLIHARQSTTSRAAYPARTRQPPGRGGISFMRAPPWRLRTRNGHTNGAPSLPVSPSRSRGALVAPRSTSRVRRALFDNDRACDRNVQIARTLPRRSALSVITARTPKVPYGGTASRPKVQWSAPSRR